MNPTSTLQFSTFPQNINQGSYWDVNSTSGTNVRYASNNKSQKENFNSSQGKIFPAIQYYVENPAMAVSTTADTSALNPVLQPCANSSALIPHHPNLSFCNQLPQNYPGPSNHLTMYDPTKGNYNISKNVESRQSAMQDFKISHFQEKEYDTMSTARKLNRTEKNKRFVSDLNSTSLNVQYHENPHTEKKSREKIQPCLKNAQAHDESSDFMSKFSTALEALTAQKSSNSSVQESAFRQ
ncbi:hypothetical protein CDAR_54441 [Caerostris darwini]|uniref:Uncharacterized protein n=1 Tax=Caerostris darwini TaxID=1538125 RepID=A0AAV4Q6E8_9ARAC|nr:hypothetical protein CDAR_54441 [Caerostris darwini]